MRRNPRGGDGGVLEIALLGVGAWFLFRTPAAGGPSLFAQMTSGITGGTASAPGQLTIPPGTPLPAGYRVLSVSPTGTRVIAPAPPGTAGYVPSVYAAVGAVGTIGGLVTSLTTALTNLFRTTPAPVDAAPVVYSTVGANPALATATAQFDAQGNVVGYYQVNADGTTTTWDAAGGNPVVTDPSGALAVAPAPIPDLTVAILPTVDPGTGLPIDLTAPPPDPSLGMDIYASGL